MGMRWVALGVVLCSGCSLLVGDDSDSGNGTPGECPPSPSLSETDYVEFCFDTPQPSPIISIHSRGGLDTDMFFDIQESVEVDDGGLVLGANGVDNGAFFTLAPILSTCQSAGSGITIEVVAAQSADQIPLSFGPRRIFDSLFGTVGGIVLGADLATGDLVVRTPEGCAACSNNCEEASTRELVDDEFTHMAVRVAPTEIPELFVNAVAAPFTENKLCTLDTWPAIDADDATDLALGKAVLWSEDNPDQNVRRFWSGTIRYISVSCTVLALEDLQARANVVSNE